MGTYTIVSGDTLSGIAKKFYNDAGLYGLLASFNGIPNPDLIYADQVIEIPEKDVLTGDSTTPTAQHNLTPPHGLDQIKTVFGDIFDYIDESGALSPGWESEFFTRAPLPFSIRLSWDLSKYVRNLYCHKKLADIFPAVFADIAQKGLQDRIRTFGGCFNYRPKRNGSKISTHSWAIAIDLNPDSNQMGTDGDMDRGIVEIFQGYGFTWGGDWSGSNKDPMHFQFCNGY
jgi:hypothetical protein